MFPFIHVVNFLWGNKNRFLSMSFILFRFNRFWLVVNRLIYRLGWHFPEFSNQAIISCDTLIYFLTYYLHCIETSTNYVIVIPFSFRYIKFLSCMFIRYLGPILPTCCRVLQYLHRLCSLEIFPKLLFILLWPLHWRRHVSSSWLMTS